MENQLIATIRSMTIYELADWLKENFGSAIARSFKDETIDGELMYQLVVSPDQIHLLKMLGIDTPFVILRFQQMFGVSRMNHNNPNYSRMEPEQTSTAEQLTPTSSKMKKMNLNLQQKNIRKEVINRWPDADLLPTFDDDKSKQELDVFVDHINSKFLLKKVKKSVLREKVLKIMRERRRSTRKRIEFTMDKTNQHVKLSSVEKQQKKTSPKNFEKNSSPNITFNEETDEDSPGFHFPPIKSRKLSSQLSSSHVSILSSYENPQEDPDRTLTFSEVATQEDKSFDSSNEQNVLPDSLQLEEMVDDDFVEVVKIFTNLAENKITKQMLLRFAAYTGIGVTVTVDLATSIAKFGRALVMQGFVMVTGLPVDKDTVNVLRRRKSFSR